MKIDLLYELQMPRPWISATPESDCFWQAMDQIRLADQVGFNTVWVVEHHFQTEYSHSSAPEVFLGAVSQQTSHIRLGHGVVLLPMPFNHPVRVAERVATLDILSRGRVEFGVGRSAMGEQKGFEIDASDSRAMMLEALAAIPKMWTSETFSWDGRYFRVPERAIVPKPVQKPHPPIWQASTSPDSWTLAGANQIGALGLTILLPLELMKENIDNYWHAYERGTPIGAASNGEVRVFTIVHCAETTRQAIDNGGNDAALMYIDYVLNRLLRDEIALEKAGGEGPRPYSQFLDRFDYLKSFADGQRSAEMFDEQSMIIVGDPDKCIEKIEEYEKLGANGVLCMMQTGRIAHEHVMKSIELFGQYVIPYFQDRDARRAAAESGA
jgi:alkanesulfonate monooxygenase SsuD/methylene tetrahydromethanopterin reductase-like flavin-dependent oxidoreductase (luciferase family)